MNRKHSAAALLDTIPMVTTPLGSPRLDRLAPLVRPAGKPRGYQCWHSLLFLHWPVPYEQLRPLVPQELALDLHQQTAYLGVVLFAMEGVRHRSWPRLLSLQFLEANVRTYVHYRGTPGIYFLSLDANSRLAVWGARTGWSLPYHHAQMKMTTEEGETEFHIRRSRSGLLHHARYRVGEMLAAPEPGTLEYFLLERYWLFVRHRDQLCKAQVHHCPYPAQDAELLEFDDQLLASAGLPQLNGDPPLVHYAERVDTEIFGLQRA